MQAQKPVYIVSGDEPLLVQETCDSIRQQAMQSGMVEREQLQVDNKFDWQQLRVSASSGSLFASQKLIELSMPSGKPGKVGGKVLTEWANSPPPATTLLISCERLDSSVQNTKWFKSIKAAGSSIQVWPVESDKLTQWVIQRGNAKNLEIDRHAAELLAEKVEGNLLAASQEIEKLALLVENGKISEKIVSYAVADNSRYNSFELLDSALAGDKVRVNKILIRLKQEGVEVLLVVGSLSWAVRDLLSIASEVKMGTPVGKVLSSPMWRRAWARRKSLVTKVIKRHSLASLSARLRHLGKVDKIAKGVLSGNVWDELLTISLNLSGTKVI